MGYSLCVVFTWEVPIPGFTCGDSLVVMCCDIVNFLWNDRISGSIPFLVPPHNELPMIGKLGWAIPQATCPSWSATFVTAKGHLQKSIWPYPCDRHYDLMASQRLVVGVQKLYFCIFRWDEHPQLPTVLVSKKQDFMGFKFQDPQFVQKKSQHSRPGKNRPAISWCSSRLEVSSWLPVWSLSLGRDMKSWAEGTKCFRNCLIT